MQYMAFSGRLGVPVLLLLGASFVQAQQINDQPPGMGKPAFHLQMEALAIPGDEKNDSIPLPAPVDPVSADPTPRPLGESAISNMEFLRAVKRSFPEVDPIPADASSAHHPLFNAPGMEMASHPAELSHSYHLVTGRLNFEFTVNDLLGETFRTRVGMAELEAGDELLNELFLNPDGNSSRMTTDFGFSLRPLSFLTLGIQGRTLLPEEFDASGNSDGFDLDSQVRMGVGISAFGFLRIGLDFDLFESNLDGMVDSPETQYMGGGVEFDLGGGELLNVKLRAGGFTDLATGSSNPVWSMGLGMKFLGLTLDLKGLMDENSSSDPGSIRLPDEVVGTMALGFEIQF